MGQRSEVKRGMRAGRIDIVPYMLFDMPSTHWLQAKSSSKSVSF